MAHDPWRRFDSFLAPGADRAGVLESLLDEFRLPFAGEEVAGNRHIFLGPGPEAPGLGMVDREKGRTVLVAHYDRVEGSPGANDNSAAVFLLLEAALSLRAAGAENWLVIFTDKEELGKGGAIQDQGAYSLALALRDSGLGRGQFFIFDACGAGDWLIISTMADHVIRSGRGEAAGRVRRQCQLLRDRALSAARRLNMEKLLLAPVPFSDDLGFLRAGITAQTITALPAAEANRLASNLRNRPGFTDTLIRGGDRSGEYLSLVPETWKSLNGPADTKERLTPEHYRHTVRFAAALCGC